MASASVSLDRGLLPRVARAINASLGLGDVLAAASRAAAELMPDSLVLVWTVQGDRLVLRAAAGHLTQACTGLPITLAVGEGLAGHVALTREVAIVEDPAADPRARCAAALRNEGVRTFVGLPLAGRHARVGVLTIFSRRPGRPRPGTLDALGVLTSQAAFAIESTRLFADSERRRRTAEALAEVSQALAHSLDPREVSHLIADNVLALLGVRDVILYELQPGTGHLVSVAFAGEGVPGLPTPIVLPPGAGVPGRAVMTRREVFTPDVLNAAELTHPPELRDALERGGYRAVVSVPLLVNGEPIGALAVAARRDRALDEESRRLLGVFADQAAIALRNARLFAAERAARAEAEAAERRVRDLVHGVDGIVTEVELPARRAVFVGGRVETLLGYTAEQWLTEPDFWRSHIHPDDRERVVAYTDAEIAAGRDHVLEYRMLAAAGRVVWVRDSVTLAAGRLQSLKVDVTERKRTEALLASEKRVLEMIAAGEPLAAVLDAVCQTIEEQDQAMLCTVVLVDGERLRHGAAPSLPKAYVDAIDGIAWGPEVGTCGTAVARRQPVIVEDIAADPRWHDYRDLARAHGLHACWSLPVLDAAGVPVAAFAMYYRTPRRPTDADCRLIERAVHLVGIAIDHAGSETALRASEERYRTLATNIPDVVWLVDRAGRPVFISPNVTKVTGYTPEEVYAAGPALWFDRIHPDDRPLVRKRFEALIRDQEGFDLEYRMRHRDGRWIWLHDRAVARYEEHGVGYVYGLYSDITDRKQAEQIRALLLNQVITVQEEERQRIARELHDETAQSLASLLLGLSALQEARTVKAARAQARELQQVATRALAEVRRLAWGLRPSVLDDLGLATALERYAGDFGRTRSIAVEVDTAGLEEARLAPAVETALYRIMQEALSNVARHAGARTVRVSLHRRPAAVSMTVEDDGHGFDPGRASGPTTAARGLGIHTMRERAAVLKGALVIDSVPGQGTRVAVEIPLSPDAA